MILQISYYLLLVILYSIVFKQFRIILRRQFSDPVRRKRIRHQMRIGTALYLVVIIFVSESGLLLPLQGLPRIPIFLIIPAFILWAYILFSKRTKYLKVHTPIYLPIVLQFFRVGVELLLWGAFVEGLIPKAATFEGYNYEILVACSAPVLAYLVWNKQIIPEKFMILWNYLGLVSLTIIVGIFIVSAYFGGFESLNPGFISTDFIQFPYMLVPGLFMPFAVFLHIFSIRQLRLRS